MKKAPPDIPRIWMFILVGAGIGAAVGAAGMVIWAIQLNEQTKFGSSAAWSPLYAIMGAVPGGLAGIVLGLIGFLVSPAPPKDPSDG
jgi:hypothetical protein